MLLVSWCSAWEETNGARENSLNKTCKPPIITCLYSLWFHCEDNAFQSEAESKTTAQANISINRRTCSSTFVGAQHSAGTKTVEKLKLCFGLATDHSMPWKIEASNPMETWAWRFGAWRMISIKPPRKLDLVVNWWDSCRLDPCFSGRSCKLVLNKF